MPDRSGPSADEVRASDELIQRITSGAQLPTGDELGDLLARWLTEIAEVRVSADGLPDPGRHAFHADTPVYAATRSAMNERAQDDLSDRDGEYVLTNTDKLGPADEGVEQPPQEPWWRPDWDIE